MSPWSAEWTQRMYSPSTPSDSRYGVVRPVARSAVSTESSGGVAAGPWRLSTPALQTPHGPRRPLAGHRASRVETRALAHRSCRTCQGIPGAAGSTPPRALLELQPKRRPQRASLPAAQSRRRAPAKDGPRVRGLAHALSWDVGGEM
eukprot:scaffold732_cov60-Phaeocystis_antarctica.AAC.19